MEHSQQAGTGAVGYDVKRSHLPVTPVTDAPEGIIYKGAMASTMDVKNELYADLSDEVRQQLAKHEKMSTVPQGTVLVERGIAPDQLIILNSGSAESSVPVGGKVLSLGVAGPGKVFALQSILSGEAPHACVTCLEECGITVLPKDAFLNVLRHNPQMYFAIIKILSADLASADDVIRDHGRGSRLRPRPDAFRRM